MAAENDVKKAEKVKKVKKTADIVDNSVSEQ